ncbi:MAG: T9SS type A sorting domain-containing protein, partial [Bacteroidales bacterium]
AAPQITSTAVTMGVEGIAYTYTITITGTPAPSLSVSGNPSWLTLNGNILSGIPTSTGTTGSITITATNTQGSDQQVFSIDVASVPKITSTPVTSAIAGSSYTYNVTATGTPAPEYSISGNPSWLSVTGSTISGIPESSGLIGPITVTATNVASSDAQTFYIYVNNPAVNTSAEKLIHYWHFNNTLPVDGSGGIYFGPNPIPADFSIIGGAALVYKPLSGVVSDTGQVDNLVGDTLNQRMGFGGCCGDVNNAIRTRNPSDSMQFLWYIPTKSYKNIVIKYETELSSLKSGQHEQIFSYSLDSAMTFINNGLPVLSNFADTVWQVVTLDLRSIPEVNDNNNLVLRILYSAPNTGSKGNNRFDNITVEGDKIPVEYVMPEYESEGYSLYPNPASDYITLTSDNDGNRKIEIFNSAGILINQTVMTDRQLLINTSKLSPGLYFVKIKDSNHGIIIKLKFIKQ